MKTLIRLPNWIGDAVMATPTVRALTRIPEEEVWVWGPPKTAALFRHFPDLSGALELDEKEEPGRLSEIKVLGFDRVLLLTNSYSTAQAASNAGVPERIGYNRQWRGRFLTRKVFCGPAVRNLHMVDYYLYLVSKILDQPGGWDRRTLLKCSDEELSLASERIRAGCEETAEGKLIAFCPGAAYGPAKQWFPERFKLLAESLANQRHRVLILGGENERELGEAILAGLPDNRSMNLAGATNIRELMATLCVCDGLVTNDSGPLHLADALGTPAVALFGSTDSTWTGPQGAKHEILQAEVACNPCFLRECPLDMECMRSLTSESARLAVDRILC